MKCIKWICLITGITIAAGCTKQQGTPKYKQPVYQDVPYLQDYAIKYKLADSSFQPRKVVTDRNGIIQILASNQLFRAHNGHFQHPGSLTPDNNYVAMADRIITDLITFRDQFVYLDNQAVLSNAWAGKLLSKHRLPSAKILCAGAHFDFMITDSTTLIYQKDSQQLWKEQVEGQNILSIKFDKTRNLFFILGEKSVFSFSVKEKILTPIHTGNKFTCFEISKTNQNLVIGTNEGYFTLDFNGNPKTPLYPQLPWTELTTLKEINGKLWFGSTKGAFMLREDGRFNYYHGARWLPGNRVEDISAGPDNSVLILTDRGLGQICFKKMTLEDKAMVFEDQVRKRHIRYGINANVTQLTNHNLSTNHLRKADSDNLWTAMYLGSQLFRYLATGSEEAKQNCYESFEALERFHTINNVKGLFGRTFERRGYQEFRNEYRTYVENYWYPGYNNVTSWYHANEDWDWRASASSDQTVGQVFAMTLIATYIDDPEWKQRAVKILDDLMTYIVENDFNLVDKNGKPSLWGRWGPEYVNRFDKMIGDRKVYSSNMIAFLQSAYQHTGKEIFKEKAFELMDKHGYLENLMRPFSEIGPAPADADEWSKMLSEEWNHSDDEMYFLAYWSLFPDAFDEELKEQYRIAIKDHWQWERPEKNPLWNFCYAMTGAREFDLEESIWTLKEWPLDMIQFAVENSHRKDIELIKKNFWGQITKEILPPDERPELKHNRNLFKLDAGDRGSELSAGDTFLLPYWMGRYLGVISAPVTAEYKR
ncbi:hypothetical protein QQ020_12715 [Fulvivirgaceae bacterium BMA12]|uniref:Uncharacterized protein n=1 Tax=Agaribacillus aureus TaxID=3051825 RepID=A0ABT8L595_9BACT|nr:hypothetical protein [Fulvivirgaceae bacterium BMA12]